jgi:cytochrome c oxidase subunit 4
MSTTTGAVAADTATTVDHGADDHSHDAHSDLKYIKVAILLAVLTAIEVGVYYIDMSSAALTAILIPLMVVKFWLVAAYFMHLKNDTPLFTKMFVAGLVFAIGVYSVMLTTFHYWS